MISDDLVNSYHLLLCALDLVYCNALLCSSRKDLLNPAFKGPTQHSFFLKTKMSHFFWDQLSRQKEITEGQTNIGLCLFCVQDCLRTSTVKIISPARDHYVS